MGIADLINGLFEIGGGITILFSVVKLHHEKQVRGVHWLPVLFFTSWGIWNLFYCPNLGQWVSFAGGLFIVVVNAVWLGQMIYYQSKNNQPHHE